ncbi:MAG: hypothetical protein VX083_00795 [Pseudomonadota bacterium]|nr:hypothetical protein [Pseudomonadota bacterium]
MSRSGPINLNARRRRQVCLWLLSALILLWSLTPMGAHLQSQTNLIAVQAEMIADHGHSHDDLSDRLWAQHGHNHDVTDHDHSAALILHQPQTGFEATWRGNAFLWASLPKAPPVFRRDRPPRQPSASLN